VTMINLARGAILLVAAMTAAALAGCASGPGSVTHAKAVVDVGQLPGGDRGSPSPVPVPSTLPTAPATGSRALCRQIPALTQLEVARDSTLPGNHITFSFPARVTVTKAVSVRAVATVLCGLPRDTTANCPADFGVRYWLYFSPAQPALVPVDADPAGCADVLGLGVMARWGLPRFWRELGTAMSLVRPGENSEAVYRLFGGSLPGPQD
jgi:hypothetical protein